MDKLRSRFVLQVWFGDIPRIVDRIWNVHTMTDMAVEHYHELRIKVTSRISRAKKVVEATLQ